MDEGPIFSFLIRGNLNNSISLKLCQSNFKHGLWQMNIRSIILKSHERIDLPVSIHSNFINDIQFNHFNEIERYNPTLAIFHLSSNLNEIKLYTMNDAWFTINSMNEKLEFFFKNSFTNEKMNFNVETAVHVFLKRVK